jgi:hypothetical protein
VRTEAMEKKSAAGWLRFNAADNLVQLEKGLTPRLELRAGDRRRLETVRSASRESVEKFVRRWVLESQPNIEQMKIVVRFPDEVGAAGGPTAVTSGLP